MKNFIITDINKNDKVPANYMPQRADFALSFICYAELNGKKGLMTYDYNPIWKTWYPFYDDLNKQPTTLHTFTQNTFGGLIDEYEQVMSINLDYQISKAKERFEEIFDTTFNFKALSPDFVTYELKHSQSADKWTFYKFFYFVITDVKKPNQLIKPKGMRYKFIDGNQIEGSGLVANVAHIYDKMKVELQKHTIDIREGK